MNAELTDRYVWAIARSLPEAQRPVVEGELRTQLSTMVDQRVAAGADALTAEREAILELGDPDRRAASWTNRPRHLIGPAYFFDYVRLLKLLMSIVVPIASVAVLLAQLLSGSDIAESITAAIVTAFNVAVQIAFWLTFVFAVIEQTSGGTRPLTTWTPDRLPTLPRRSHISVTETVVGAAGLLIFAGVIVWQQFSSFYLDDKGSPIPFLEPGLWSSWLPYFMILIALEIGFLFLKFGQGRWTWLTATVNVGLAVAFTVPAVWLLNTGRLLNSEFLTAAEQATTLRLETSTFYVVTTVIVIVLAAWDSIDGFVRTIRANREFSGARGDRAAADGRMGT